ncbi:MAG: prepilin-type N-terminal cleavage/methylation domain-containing protein [Defluviitaleaceae bacterium]|nr:prepilin-type N-terminal cleavage/methylation domain-containing protein [Defluviitaleaceae bacterium]MCL2262453.1 prepilin-type N-terminal cleavage/methylation domain-containing protein [Defluviitaleaceae bacterium]
MKKCGGLTLMELTIVLAILAIIAGILIPVFMLTTERARLRGDISSARVIQNAIEIYVAERGSTAIMSSNDVNAIVARLADLGHINPRNTSIQTAGETWTATWVRHNHPDYGRIVMVDISAAPDEIHRAYASLPPAEQAYVLGGDRNR